MTFFPFELTQYLNAPERDLFDSSCVPCTASCIPNAEAFPMAQYGLWRHNAKTPRNWTLPRTILGKHNDNASKAPVNRYEAAPAHGHGHEVAHGDAHMDMKQPGSQRGS